MKLPPAGTILTPRGRHLHGTCSILGRTYPASLGSLWSPLRKFCPSACFRKGSRGGTWNVPRDMWRHVTHTIVVPALWRIEWAWSRPDPTIRSAAIDESAAPALPLRPAGTRALHGEKFLDPLHSNPFGRIHIRPYLDFSVENSPYPPISIFGLKIPRFHRYTYVSFEKPVILCSMHK